LVFFCTLDQLGPINFTFVMHDEVEVASESESDAYPESFDGGGLRNGWKTNGWQLLPRVSRALACTGTTHARTHARNGHIIITYSTTSSFPGPQQARLIFQSRCDRIPYQIQFWIRACDLGQNHWSLAGAGWQESVSSVLVSESVWTSGHKKKENKKGKFGWLAAAGGHL